MFYFNDYFCFLDEKEIKAQVEYHVKETNFKYFVIVSSLYMEAYIYSLSSVEEGAGGSQVLRQHSL